MTNLNKNKSFCLLNYLKQKNILNNFSTGVKPSTAYYLAEHTKSLMISGGIIESAIPFSPSKYSPTGFFHRTGLIKIELIFSYILGSRLLTYDTEGRIKRQKTQIINNTVKYGDAELCFHNKKGEKKYGLIELELSLKNPQRRRTMISNIFEYCKPLNINMIFLFYNNKYIKSLYETDFTWYINSLESTMNKPMIIFVDLNQFVNLLAKTEAEVLGVGNITFETL